MLLHPDWSNASDFQKTRERFGTVALHSAELGVSIEAIKLNITEIKAYIGPEVSMQRNGDKAADPTRSRAGGDPDVHRSRGGPAIAARLREDGVSMVREGGWCVHLS